MIERAKVAVVGVGNTISALVQGIALYRSTGSLAGIRRPVLDGLGVGDIDFVAAFAVSPDKIGTDLAEAIFLPPNNFPRLAGELPLSGVAVQRGLTDATEVERVAGQFAGAEVVLYAAPSGRPETARAYAEAALRGERRSSTPHPMRWRATGSGWIGTQRLGCPCWVTTWPASSAHQ